MYGHMRQMRYADGGRWQMHLRPVFVLSLLQLPVGLLLRLQQHD